MKAKNKTPKELLDRYFDKLKEIKTSQDMEKIYKDHLKAQQEKTLACEKDLKTLESDLIFHKETLSILKNGLIDNIDGKTNLFIYDDYTRSIKRSFPQYFYDFGVEKIDSGLVEDIPKMGDSNDENKAATKAH